jgi:LPS sulfotransferase NodH
MGSDRDVSIGGQPEKHYAILSVPRSGSTLLARGMEASGLLGVPLENINQNAIDAWKYLGGHLTAELDIYLSDIQKRRTSESGWFGLKVHYRHFDHHFKETAFDEAVKFIQRQDRCVLITRDDWVAQSVSYYRARMTGLWSSEHEEHLDRSSNQDLSCDTDALTQCLEEISYGETMWREVLAETGHEFLEIHFEDLINDYVCQVQSVFDFIGVNNALLPEKQLQSVSTHVNDSIEIQFREFLCSRYSGPVEPTKFST